jgi:uncharacterized integral membrane protein
MSDASPKKSSPRKIETRQILIMVAAVLLAWFAIGNWQSVTIHFWLSTTRAPLVLVIVVSALLGGFVTRLARRRHRPASHDQ